MQKKPTRIVHCALAVLWATCLTAQAQMVLVPPDRNPDNANRSLFVTKSATDATSADIAVNNGPGPQVFLHYSLDGSGATANDFVFLDDSGNNNHGTLVDLGTPDNTGFVDSPAAFGQAWNAPSQNDQDRIDLTTPFDPGGAQPWAIAFWHDMSGGISMPLFDSTTSSHTFLLRADAENVAQLKIAGQATVEWDTSGIITQGGFHHYAIVADPTGIDGVDLDSDGNDDNVALYVDGVAVIPNPGQNLHQYGTAVFMDSFHDGSSSSGSAFTNGHGVSDELWVFEQTLTQTMIDLLISCNSILDGDGDGVCDPDDICSGFDDNVDSDSDGVPDGCDLCEGWDDNVDTDSDGIPDRCDVVPVPPDLNPGDQYRLLFVTSSVTDAMSADIAVYNALVAADAAAVAELDALGTTFTAVASTPTVDALDNTMTDPSPPGDTGVPIYLVNGTRFADDYDSLWTSAGPLVGGVPIPDGSLPFIPTSSGNGPPNTVWTGTSPLGIASANVSIEFGPLGDSDDDAQRGTPRDGTHPFPNTRWIRFGGASSLTAELPLYGMSGVLTVPCVENITQGTSHATIQDALDAAVSGNVIELGACTFHESGFELINKDITIRGQGRDQTIIDAEYNGRVFRMQNGDDSVLEDLTIRRGVPVAANGGAAVQVMFNCDPVFRRVDFRDCDGAGFTSGAVDCSGSGTTMVFEACRFLDNFGAARNAYGGFATTTFLNCLFAGNSGGASTVHARAPMELVNCTFADNTDVTAMTAGSGGDATARNCVFDAGNPSGTIGTGITSVITSLFPGATGDNIDGLPTFVDTPGGDYRLAAGSLVIDAADHDAYVAVGGGATDLNGDPRTHDDTGAPDTGLGTPPYLDMGAYEFQGTTVPGECNGDGNIDLDDYDDFAACLLGLGAGLGIDCNCFDFDHDGDVTLADFAEFQVDFTGN